MASVPRRLSLVRFVSVRSQKGLRAASAHHPFKKTAVYVFLGEIPNVPGHCVVIDAKIGKVYSGYHTENFREIPPDET